MKKIVTLRDRYGSTTRYYPKVLKECLPADLQDMLPLTKGNFTGKIYFDEWDTNALAPVVEIKKDATHKAELRAWGNNVLGNDVYGVEMQYQEGNALATVSVDTNGVQIFGSNKDINIITTGTGKFYINGEEYQAGGGGKTLYQHNIYLHKEGTRYLDCFNLLIQNDNPNQMTFADIKTYLYDNGYIYDNNSVSFFQNAYIVSGAEFDKNNYTVVCRYVGLCYLSTTTIKSLTDKGSGDITEETFTITDNVKAL